MNRLDINQNGREPTRAWWISALWTAAVILPLLGGSPARADFPVVAQESGDWFDWSIWWPDDPITIEDDVSIGTGYTVTVNDTGAVARAIHVGSTFAGGTLIIDGGELTTATVRSDVAPSESEATSTIHVNGGRFDAGSSGVGGSVFIGAELNGQGVVNVSGGEFMTYDMRVGHQGIGILNISDTGSVSLVRALTVGHIAGGNGTINLSGGSLHVQQDLTLGRNDEGAIGTMNISGGSFDVRRLYVSTGGAGTLAVQGAEATITAEHFITFGAGGTYVADIGPDGITTLVAGNNYDITLAGTLEIGVTDLDYPASAVLFQTQGIGKVLGTFNTVIWKDGLSGELVYESDRLRVELEVSEIAIEQFEQSPEGHMDAVVSSVPGQEYTLWYTQDLTAEPVDWTEVQSLPGTGDTLTLTDPDPTDAMRIYRIGVTPLDD